MLVGGEGGRGGRGGGRRPPPRSCRPPCRSCPAQPARSWWRSIRSAAGPRSRRPRPSRPARRWKRSRRRLAPPAPTRSPAPSGSRSCRPLLTDGSDAVGRLASGLSLPPSRRTAPSWRPSKSWRNWPARSARSSMGWAWWPCRPRCWRPAARWKPRGRGEAGRGFAVVSGDIRTLARDASHNADAVRIWSPASSPRSPRSGARSIRSTPWPAPSSTRTAPSRRALAQVALDTAALKAGADDIAKGAEDVLSASAQVLSGIGQIASAAEEASSAAAQAAAAARQRVAERRRTGRGDRGDRAPGQRAAASRGRYRMASVETRQRLTVRAGGARVAMAAEGVAEVIRTPRITRMPNGPPGLLGVTHLRGLVLPVVSLGALLGDEAQARRHAAWWCCAAIPYGPGRRFHRGAEGFGERRRRGPARSSSARRRLAARAGSISTRPCETVSRRSVRHLRTPEREVAASPDGRRRSRTWPSWALSWPGRITPCRSEAVAEVMAVPKSIAAMPRTEAVLIGGVRAA